MRDRRVMRERRERGKRGEREGRERGARGEIIDTYLLWPINLFVRSSAQFYFATLYPEINV